MTIATRKGYKFILSMMMTSKVFAIISFLCSLIVGYGQSQACDSGVYNYPPGCQGSQCQYRALWEVQGSDVMFSVVARQPANLWTGIGISRNSRMAATDVLLAYLRGDGTVAFEDRFATGYGMPGRDSLQDITPLGGGYQNGQLAVRFSRPLDTGDSAADIALTAGPTCSRLVFPVEGGPYNEATAAIGMHQQTPIVSEPICLSPCN